MSPQKIQNVPSAGTTALPDIKYRTIPTVFPSNEGARMLFILSMISTYSTVSRDSSNLLILVYIEANLDPLKKSFAHLPVLHGVVDSIAASSGEIVAWLGGVLIP